MDPITIIYIVFLVLSFVILALYYWKDSTEEGFSNTKIFDSYFIAIIGGLLGGKLLFRELSLDFFKYQFLTAPLILEGVLVGGGIFLYVYIKYQGLDTWKIGDMIAPALTLFQSVISLGIGIITGRYEYFYISAFFFVLFLVLRYLRITRNLGSSKRYFELKRYNKFLFTGLLIALYLTVSSVVAILFLVINLNLTSRFWWFQVIFYLVILFGTAIRLFRKLRKVNK